MHELAVTRGILDTVIKGVREAGPCRVTRISLVMGGMLDYEIEWLQKYFTRLALGSCCEGAVLEAERIPVSFCCSRCGHVFPMETRGTGGVGCPACGSLDYTMKDGRQFFVDRVEVEPLTEEELDLRK